MNLPAGTDPVILCFLAAAPAEVEGVFIDDRRRLGVTMSRAVLSDGNALAELDLACADVGAGGWR